MGAKTVLPVLTLLCIIGAVWCQSCRDEACEAEGGTDDDGNVQDKCCEYFRDSCCSTEENDYLTLLFRLVIGLTVTIVGLITLFVIILLCCCCCGCIACLDCCCF